MRIYASLLMVLLFMLQLVMPEIHHDAYEHKLSYSAPKATGVDISVTEISYSYTNPTDQQKYQVFSSQSSHSKLPKPEQLFVIDAVIDIPINIEVTAENLGNSILQQLI